MSFAKTSPANVIIVIIALTVTTRGADVVFDDAQNDSDVTWVRLCTLTRNGSSLISAAMPCGIRVQSDGGARNREETVGKTDRLDESENRTAVVDDRLDRDNNTDRRHQGGFEMNREGVGTAGEVSGNSQGGLENDRVEESNVRTENGSSNSADEENVYGDNEYEDDDIAVEVENDQRDDLSKQQKRGTVAKVMLTYLLDARNQLYGRIHHILNLLQHAFFNGKFRHRSRRSLMERRTILLTSEEGRQKNKKKPQNSSVIMEPTFERSLMTMSFLMFGVFVIQVVQRLMQTLNQSGESTSMDNFVSGSLPTLSSSIF